MQWLNAGHERPLIWSNTIKGHYCKDEISCMSWIILKSLLLQKGMPSITNQKKTIRKWTNVFHFMLISVMTYTHGVLPNHYQNPLQSHTKSKSVQLFCSNRRVGNQKISNKFIKIQRSPFPVKSLKCITWREWINVKKTTTVQKQKTLTW